MAINSYADISDLVDNIHEDALVAIRENALATRLVRVFLDGRGVQPRDVTEYGTVLMNQVGFGEDLVGQSFNRSPLSTITPIRRGGQILVDDARLETDPENYRLDAATELGESTAQIIDTDVFGNFSSITGGTIGSAGTTLAWGHIAAAGVIMRNNQIPGPYFGVIHPYQWHDLASSVLPGATVTNAPAFQDDIARNYFVARFAGIDIFTSTNVPTDGTDATGAVFSRNAIAFDQRRGFSIEPERDASREAWELNGNVWYAHGTWRANFGVQVLSDITEPTE